MAQTAHRVEMIQKYSQKFVTFPAGSLYESLVSKCKLRQLSI